MRAFLINSAMRSSERERRRHGGGNLPEQQLPADLPDPDPTAEYDPNTIQFVCDEVVRLGSHG